MTLGDVAARFEEAGIAERSRALLSLQRCQPGCQLVTTRRMRRAHGA